MSVFRLYVLNVTSMFLLKCKIKGLEPFQSIFQSDLEAEKYLNTISPDSIEDWSIHPLFVQEPIKSKDISKPFLSVSVIKYGDSRASNIIRNISVDNLYDLVLKDFNFEGVSKILLIPHA